MIYDGEQFASQRCIAFIPHGDANGRRRRVGSLPGSNARLSATDRQKCCVATCPGCFADHERVREPCHH